MHVRRERETRLERAEKKVEQMGARVDVDKGL